MAKETKQHRSWVEAPVVEAEILAADSTARRGVARSRMRAGGRRHPYVPPRKPFNFGRWFRATGWRHIVGIVMVVFALFPIVFVVSSSLNPQGTLTGSNALFSEIGLDSYVRILTDPQVPYTQWFANTLVIAGVTAVGTVFLGALAAYSFSRMRFTGRRVGLISIVVVQMFPQMLAVVAIFLLMSSICDWFPAIGLNTHIGLIMVYLGGALGVNTFLMYGFFNTIPASIDEAAKIDGAGPRAHLLHDHPAARRADPRGGRAAVVHLHGERVRRGIRAAHRHREADARGRPHEAGLQPAVRGLERLLGRRRDGGAARWWRCSSGCRSTSSAA